MWFDLHHAAGQTRQDSMKTMKRNEANQRAGRASPSQRVHIEFHDEQAHEVCIAGTFNDWRPATAPMINVAPGEWVKDLTLPPGRYEYRFVVDGQWRTGPAASECVPNGYGDCNCVPIVPPQPSDRGATNF